MHFAHRHRLVFALVGSGIALAVLAIAAMWGLLRGPSSAGQPERPTPDISIPSTLPSPREQPQPVLLTSDAEMFARSVGRALFTWDTRYEGGLSEWAQVLVDVADPDEAAAVASDVREYLPVDAMWDQLGTYGTRQWLELESVTVPDAWSTVLAQAAPGQIPAGAAAFTLAGIRHRAGTQNTEIIRTQREVAFTVFVVCPNRETCSILRLSQLDEPLK